MSGRHASRDPRPGDRLVRAGALLFLLGVAALLLVVGGYFLAAEAPSAFTVLTALAPLGLAVALAGLLRGARADRG